MTTDGAILTTNFMGREYILMIILVTFAIR